MVHVLMDQQLFYRMVYELNDYKLFKGVIYIHNKGSTIGLWGLLMVLQSNLV